MSAMLKSHSDTSSPRSRTLNQRLSDEYTSSESVSSTHASSSGVTSDERGANNIPWPEMGTYLPQTTHPVAHEFLSTSVDRSVSTARTPPRRGRVARVHRWIGGLPGSTGQCGDEELANEAANSNQTKIQTSGLFIEPDHELTRGIGASFRMVPPGGNLIESGVFETTEDDDDEGSGDCVSGMSIFIEQANEVQTPPMSAPSAALLRARNVPKDIVPGFERRVMEHPHPEKRQAGGGANTRGRQVWPYVQTHKGVCIEYVPIQREERQEEQKFVQFEGTRRPLHIRRRSE